MKVKIHKDEHSPTIVAKFTAKTNELDHDRILSLETMAHQHKLEVDNSMAVTEQYQTIEDLSELLETDQKLIIIKDVTPDFLTDLQHWVFTGDLR